MANIEKVIVNFNGKDYEATYNEETKKYLLTLKAPEKGGAYNITASYTNYVGEKSIIETSIRVLNNKEEELKQNTKLFMWIFKNPGRGMQVKDIVELADVEINIDEETNATSTCVVVKNTGAIAGDIVAIKKDNEVIYWGVIKDISKNDNELKYTYTLDYITNLFEIKGIGKRLLSGIDGLILKNMETKWRILYFKIKPYLDPTKSITTLSGSTQCVIYQDSDKDDNWFEFQPYISTTQSGQGYFINANGKSIMYPSSFSENSQVTITDKYNSTTDDMFLEYIGNNLYRIETSDQKYALELKDEKTEDNTEIILNTTDSSKESQLFYLEQSLAMLPNDFSYRELLYILFCANLGDQANQSLLRNGNDYDNYTDYGNGMLDSFTNIQFDYEERAEDEGKTNTATNITSLRNEFENGIANLHTLLTNCIQNEYIDLDINLINSNNNLNESYLKFRFKKHKDLKPILIDLNGFNSTKHEETFDTDITTKVIVLTSSQSYTLYLTNDRTTTTDSSKRAIGKATTEYTENYKDAPSEALSALQQNAYNHNIKFNLYKEYIPLYTPIKIKTRSGTIYDTYISSISLSQNGYISYECGNIRTSFIDKLMKERDKYVKG